MPSKRSPKPTGPAVLDLWVLCDDRDMDLPVVTHYKASRVGATSATVLVHGNVTTRQRRHREAWFTERERLLDAWRALLRQRAGALRDRLARLRKRLADPDGPVVAFVQSEPPPPRELKL